MGADPGGEGKAGGNCLAALRRGKMRITHDAYAIATNAQHAGTPSSHSVTVVDFTVTEMQMQTVADVKKNRTRPSDILSASNRVFTACSSFTGS